MRLRVTHLMQVVAALALGAAMARAQAKEPVMQSLLRGAPMAAWVRVGVGNLLTAMALVGGAGLAVELARRRSPAAWGIGRWTWSIAGIFAAANPVADLASVLLLQWHRSGSCPPSAVLLRVLHRACTDQFLREFAVAWFAFWLTRRLARAAPDPAADFRERSGWEFGALVVVSSAVYRGYEAFGL